MNDWSYGAKSLISFINGATFNDNGKIDIKGGSGGLTYKFLNGSFLNFTVSEGVNPITVKADVATDTFLQNKNLTKDKDTSTELYLKLNSSQFLYITPPKGGGNDYVLTPQEMVAQSNTAQFTVKDNKFYYEGSETPYVLTAEEVLKVSDNTQFDLKNNVLHFKGTTEGTDILSAWFNHYLTMTNNEAYHTQFTLDADGTFGPEQKQAINMFDSLVITSERTKYAKLTSWDEVINWLGEFKPSVSVIFDFKNVYGFDNIYSGFIETRWYKYDIEQNVSPGETIVWTWEGIDSNQNQGKFYQDNYRIGGCLRIKPDTPLPSRCFVYAFMDDYSNSSGDIFSGSQVRFRLRRNFKYN